MKVDSLSITNFKRLRIAEVRPSGELVIVGGRNGQGKTSLLDALQSALSGTKSRTAVPVHLGEEKAEIVVETDDPPLRIRQYYTAEKGTYGITITDRNTNMTASSPSEWMGKLYSKLSFDPLAFTRLPVFEQGEALLKVIGLDLTSLQSSYQRTFEARAEVGRQVKQQEAIVGGLPASDPELPENPVSMNEVVALQQEAVRVSNLRRTIDFDVASCERELAVAQQKLETAKQQVAATTEALGHAKAEQAGAPEPLDLSEISTRVQHLEQLNERIRGGQNRRRAESLLQEKRDEHTGLEQDLADILQRKRTAIAEAHMPVPGLSVDDQGKVTYRGVPFEQSAASEQIRVSAAVALAMMPQLSVLLIRDGSLLDDDALAVLQELAEDHGAQIWLERVGTEGAQIVIEDGAVVE